MQRKRALARIAIVFCAASSLNMHMDPTDAMNKYIVAAAMFTLAAMIPVAPAWGADKAADAVLVKRQTAAIPKLRELIARAVGHPSANFRVTAGPHQMTISAINNKGETTAANRESQAALMVAAVANEIAEKDEFGQVMTIHVNYVERHGKNAPIIKGFDFFKSPAGAFVLHKT